MLRRWFIVFFVIIISGLSFGANAACNNNEIDVLGDGTQCETAHFTLTTTSTTTSFQFSLSARGTFYVDCGDGGRLSGTGVSGTIITKSSTEYVKYTCTWDSAGAHTIRFGGTATDYSDDKNVFYEYYFAAISFYLGSNTNSQKVASITGDLGKIFVPVQSKRVPCFGYTFYGCSNLTSIPTGLFDSIDTSSATNTSYMFRRTFEVCSNLTSIPTGLFDSIDTSSATNTSHMFSLTFDACNKITNIPSGLFDSIDTSSATNTSSMFSNTFSGCNKITSIPTGLFDSIDTSSSTDTSSMFSGTFSNCNKITSIPTGLFDSIDTSSATNTSHMFYSTVRGCSGLTSIPNGLFDSIDTGSSTNTSYMFYYTFYGCSGLTSIPNRLFDSIDTGSSTNTSNMFHSTFRGCSGLTSIPNGLFDSIDTSSSTDASHMFQSTFYGCNKITSIPNRLFDSIDTSSSTNTGYMFNATFRGCSGLTSIPNGLFDSIDTSSSTDAIYMFCNTFYGCSGITNIPNGLFDSIDTSSSTDASHMFEGSFYGCSGLTSIPNGLFDSIDTSSSTDASYMFRNTFYGCGGITSIPAGLFSTINKSGGYMFSGTFYNCTNISGYIPASTFEGLIANGSPTADYMWTDTFTGTNLVKTCPSDKSEYHTGYENEWAGYVSCDTITCANGYYLSSGSCSPRSYSCSAGSYLNANDAMCKSCTAGNYCAGGNFTFNGTNQGLTQCPNGYPNSAAGANTNTQCYTACSIAYFAGASAVTGNDYYGNGTDTCSATACNTGYHTTATGMSVLLTDAIGDSYLDGVVFQDLHGDIGGDTDLYNVTQNGEIVVEYNDGQKVHGTFQCSSQGGYAALVHGPDVAAIMSSLPDNTGGNCWCKVDGFIPAGSSDMQNLSGSWILGVDLVDGFGGDTEGCSYECQYICNEVFNGSDFRAKMFGNALVSISFDLNKLIGDSSMTDIVAKDLFGTIAWNSDLYNVTQNGEIVAEYDGGQKVHGMFQCSSQGGTAALIQDPDDATIMSSLPDNTGGNCWCKVDGYIPAGSTTLQSLNGSWMLGVDLVDGFGGDPEACSYSCQDVCHDVFGWSESRTKMFDATSTSAASCAINIDTCNAGYYLPSNTDNCAQCPVNSACPGGTYTFSPTVIQGIQSCATGTFAPSGSAMCYPHILHVGDSNVYLKSTKQTTPSLNFRIGNDIFYANMTTVRTKMNKDSEHYFHAQWENNHYYVCDDTTCPQ